MRRLMRLLYFVPAVMVSGCMSAPKEALNEATALNQVQGVALDNIAANAEAANAVWADKLRTVTKQGIADEFKRAIDEKLSADSRPSTADILAEVADRDRQIADNEKEISATLKKLQDPNIQAAKRIQQVQRTFLTHMTEEQRAQQQLLDLLGIQLPEAKKP